MNERELRRRARSIRLVAADMDAVRDTVDRLETLTAGKYWPYPTFYDLLFSV